MTDPIQKDEPTYCLVCEEFFEESVAQHGRWNHEDEAWEIDFGRDADE